MVAQLIRVVIEAADATAADFDGEYADADIGPN